MIPRIPLVAVAVLMAGCSSAHHAAAPKPVSMTSAQPPSTSSIIHKAALAECAKATPIAQEILDASTHDTTVGKLLGTLNSSADTWEKALRRAAKVPSAVPEGKNPARLIAVDIAYANVDLGNTALQAAFGKYSRLGIFWNKTIQAFSTALEACNQV